MTTRKWLVTATGTIAVVLASVSVASACGIADANMTIRNATDEPWDGGSDLNKNWSDCAIGRWLSYPHGCVRPVTVEGDNFENDTYTTTITEVTLWWLDAPYSEAALGGPNGPAERAEAGICETKGVRLGTATVTAKKFVTNVSVAPLDNTAADNITPRVGYVPGVSPAYSGKFHYGMNAICATWTHEDSPTTSHKGSAGAFYAIYP